MKILAVDTSTQVCSICILDDARVAAEFVSKSPLTHTERLLPGIHALMNELSWEITELNGLAVIHGPGSFTGLRIGLSVIKGLAFGLDLRVVTGNALQIAATQILGDGLICPVMDARRGEIFTGLYERKNEQLVSIQEPVSIRPDNFLEHLPKQHIRFCGPGAYVYKEEFQRHESAEFVFEDFILARTLAYYAQDEFHAGRSTSGVEVRAAYLRPSDAETRGARPRKQLDQIPRR